MSQFSIVIPCYNCKATLGTTLTSIMNQNLGDKIDVVLVDDCSTEPFDEVIDQFKNTLTLKVVQNETNLGPGMSRQKGLEAAEGDWIVFCDDDDTFVPNTFNRVRTIIRNNPSRNIIQTKFNEVTEDGQVISYSLEKGMNWIHGKFFKNSFLKENHLSFKEGLSTHEDIYFAILTRHLTNHLNSPVLMCELVTYNWYNRPESLSHKRETGIELFENHFDDYVESSFGPITTLKDILSKNEILSLGLSSILFIYFYSQGFIQLGRKHHERDIQLMKDCVVKLCDYIDISIEDLINIIYQNPQAFCQIRNKSFDSVGFFFEKDDWEAIIRDAK